jgi:hypothetical protein
VSHKPAELIGEVLEVIFALCEKDGRATLMDRGDDIVNDASVSSFIVCKGAIDILYADVWFVVEHSESSFSDDERVVERPARGLAFCIDSESHRSELHFSDRIGWNAASRFN